MSVVPDLILERSLPRLIQNGLNLSVTRALIHDACHVLVIHTRFVPVRS